MKNGVSVIVFGLVVLGLFVYLGDVVTDVSGGVVATAPVAGVNPEAGEAIFFGKGKCSTCHSMGDQGSAIRCPNLGDSDRFALPIGLRAEERARERSAATGGSYTVTDYLVESIAEPGAYVVDGYKNEMPYVYKPPIALSPDEVRAVITFLQSNGGDVDPDAIRLPKVILAAARDTDTVPWQPYMEGDAEYGEELFFDEESNAGCARCHTVDGRGGTVGPELTTVAGTRTANFIVESVLQPSKEIASGYEPYLVETTDGQYLTGVLKEKSEQGVTLMSDLGELLTIPQNEIREVVPQDVSIMPSSFADDLTVQEFHDVLSFVLTLTGEAPAAGEENPEEEDAEDGGEDE